MQYTNLFISVGIQCIIEGFLMTRHFNQKLVWYASWMKGWSPGTHTTLCKPFKLLLACGQTFWCSYVIDSWSFCCWTVSSLYMLFSCLLFVTRQVNFTTFFTVKIVSCTCYCYSLFCVLHYYKYAQRFFTVCVCVCVSLFAKCICINRLMTAIQTS